MNGVSIGEMLVSLSQKRTHHRRSSLAYTSGRRSRSQRRNGFFALRSFRRILFEIVFGTRLRFISPP